MARASPLSGPQCKQKLRGLQGPGLAAPHEPRPSSTRDWTTEFVLMPLPPRHTGVSSPGHVQAVPLPTEPVLSSSPPVVTATRAMGVQAVRPPRPRHTHITTKDSFILLVFQHSVLAIGKGVSIVVILSPSITVLSTGDVVDLVPIRSRLQEAPPLHVNGATSGTPSRTNTGSASLRQDPRREPTTQLSHRYQCAQGPATSKFLAVYRASPGLSAQTGYLPSVGCAWMCPGLDRMVPYVRGEAWPAWDTSANSAVCLQSAKIYTTAERAVYLARLCLQRPPAVSSQKDSINSPSGLRPEDHRDPVRASARLLSYLPAEPRRASSATHQQPRRCLPERRAGTVVLLVARRVTIKAFPDDPGALASVLTTDWGGGGTAPWFTTKTQTIAPGQKPLPTFSRVREMMTREDDLSRSATQQGKRPASAAGLDDSSREDSQPCPPGAPLSYESGSTQAHGKLYRYLAAFNLVSELPD
ncbi:hypothetical protein QBC47DRAFT_355466 [Echria macrotheca]|uniref:Uncharacterized protein n=1 Tax=Echria macrotheca TaxID=438768 RepID=A0AAJ0BL29_9PEZI|nr:hypothetical protein QBC47DRAFT_355466 [Echria macrotheca]